MARAARRGGWQREGDVRRSQAAHRPSRPQAIEAERAASGGVDGVRHAAEAGNADAGAMASVAQAAQRQRQWERAAELWGVCLAEFPEHPDRRWWLVAQGHTLVELGCLDAAEEAFAVVARDFPDEPAGHSGLARVAQAQNDWVRTAELCEACLTRFPAHPDRRWWLAGQGHSLVELDRLDEAGVAFAALAAAFPDEPAGHAGLARVAQARRDWPRAAELWAACLARFPDEMERWWLEAQLWTLLELGDLAGAEAAATRAIERLPEDARLATLQARVALRRRDWQAALARAEAVTRRWPEELDGWRTLVDVLAGLEDWERILELSERTADLLGDVEATTLRARALRELGELRTARQELERLAERLGGVLPPKAGIELAALASRQGAFDEAVRLLRTIVAAAPGDLWARGALARNLAGCGDVAEARRVLLEAESPVRHPALLWGFLGVAQETRDLPAMVRWAIRIIRTTWDRGFAAGLLVEALVGLGHEQLAERLIRGRLRGCCEAHELALCRFMLEYTRARYTEALAILEELALSEGDMRLIATHRQRALVRTGRMREAAELTRQLAFSARLDFPEVRRRNAEVRGFLSTVDAPSTAPTEAQVQRYRELLLSVSAVASTNPDLVKRAPTSPAYARLARGMHERRGDPAALVRWVDAEFPLARPHIRIGALAGLPMYYKHEALWQLGEQGLALECLRGALRYLFQEPYFYARYRQRYRALIARHRPDGPPRTLILIQSCRRNLGPASLLAWQIEHYIKAPILILVADEKIHVPTLRGNLLTVPGPDTYEGCTNKMARAYEYLALASNCLGVLKIDDDIFIEDFSKFSSMLDMITRCGVDYVGEWGDYVDPAYHTGKFSNLHLSLNPAGHGHVLLCYGGQGYYLSRHALRNFARLIVSYPGYVERAMVEDVMVGDVLGAAGIRPQYISLKYHGTMRVDILEDIEHLFQGIVGNA